MFHIQLVICTGFVLFLCSLSAVKSNPVLKYDSASARITNGYNASYAQFPWHVSVIGVWLDGSGKQLCGGSIISDEWILTAAHCVRNMEYVDIGIGSTDMSNPQIEYKVVNTFTMHQEYDGELKKNDVALIKLPEKLQFSETIAKIKLPSKTPVENCYVHEPGTVCGFGRLNDASVNLSQMLQFTKVEVITNDQCKSSFGTERIHDSTICAVGYFSDTQNVCSGDSGGSLVVVENGEIVQIGVIIFAVTNGCTLGYPAGYSRVTSFMDWIEEHTGLEFD